MSRRALALALALAATFVLGACRAGDLQFKNDHRLTIRSPEERERVTAPLTIAWSMTDFSVVGLDGSAQKDRGVFAVFVDRAPIAIGKNLKSIAGDDTGCRRDPRCPDAQYLADRGVYVTSKTSLRLEVLPRAVNGVGDEQHFVNIVLLDGTGRRIGESAWYRSFTMKRRGA